MFKAKSAAAAALVLIVSGNVFADGSPALMPRLYFSIGGGEPVRKATTVTPLFNVEIDAGIKSVLSCDLWDLKLNNFGAYADMIEDYIAGELDALGQEIVNAAVSYVEGTVVGALQRAMPGLYDYSQNLHAQLSADIDVAKTSCEAVAQRTRDSGNPMSDWLEASDNAKWKDMLGYAGPGEGSDGTDYNDNGSNVLTAQDDAANNMGKQSVQWFGEQRGGEGDPPIELVNDTVKVGYQLLATNATPTIAGTGTVTPSQTWTETNPITGAANATPTDSRLGQLWENDGAAAEWANKVLGEKTISFCVEACTPSQQSGAGLMAAYQEDRDDIATKWGQIMTTYSTSPPTADDMAEVSGPGVNYHSSVVDALMQLDGQDQSVFVGRLVADAALSRTVEKAIAMRRILRAASQTPSASGYEHVQEDLASYRDEIKDELEEMKWQIEMRKTLSSDTAGALINYQDAKVARGQQISRGGILEEPAGTDVIFSDGVPVTVDSLPID